MSGIDATATFHTPELVAFRHRLGGPGTRGAAWAVDVVVQAAILGVCAAIGGLVGLRSDLTVRAAVGVLLVAQFVVSWFYGAAFEWAWAGRTPGKALFGLRVVRDDGGPIALRDALLRNLLRGVDGLPVGYAVGVMTMLLDPRLRRLGDMVGGTLVVADGRVALDVAPTLDLAVSDDERQALPVGVTLTRGQRLAIEGLLLRRRTLGDERTEELAARLAPTLAARTGVVAPTALRTLELAWARATGRDR